MRANFLFDFYQLLLTPKQQEYMNFYYLEDYSLGEISEIAQVSRQAVYDNIKRTEQAMESYEQKLRLLAKYEERSKHIEKLEIVAIEQEINSDIIKMIHQLKGLE